MFLCLHRSYGFMIQITKPFLPPIQDYIQYIEQIWERNWLTNNGPLVNELELKLKQHLDVPHMLFVTNGTIALQLAIKALGLKGEIITTPFSYVATTSSIVWENCTPVFCDIDPNTFNIDPECIEKNITGNTSAILATHTFGNTCDIDRITELAEKHSLKVIYDGAHVFGTRYKGRSVFSYGDITTASFHATKIFHTIEGGAVFTQNAELLSKLAFMRNFGHRGPEHFEGLGINGKNSEFHAAMGLATLKYVDQNIAQRKKIHERYIFWMQYIKGRTVSITIGCEPNYAYFPLLFDSKETMLQAKELLEAHWIFPRRYFYPGLNKLNYVKETVLPVADCISERILCLPVFDKLTEEDIDFICRLILRAQNNPQICLS